MNLSLILLIIYLVFCSYSDIKNKYIPYMPTIIIFILLSILQFASVIISNKNILLFIISFIPGLIMLLLSYITRESIGYGDSILLALCTICIGIWNGIFVIMCAFIYAAIFSLFLLFKGKKHRETIPFIPFIFLSLLSYLLLF